MEKYNDLGVGMRLQGKRGEATGLSAVCGPGLLATVSIMARMGMDLRRKHGRNWLCMVRRILFLSRVADFCRRSVLLWGLPPNCVKTRRVAQAKAVLIFLGVGRSTSSNLSECDYTVRGF